MKMRGQALSETLVGMLVLVPILILIPYVGRYLDVKHKAQDASRYAIWERTVFSDPSAGWDAGENSKSDAALAEEIDRRILGDPRALLGDTDQSANPLWRDHQDADLVQLDDRALNVSETPEPFDYGLTGEGFLGVQLDISLITSLAYEGLPLLNQLEPLSDLLGGALDFNLGLNDSGFTQANVAIPAVALPDFVRAGVVNSTTPSNDVLQLRGSGALLADAWVPGSEGNYRDRLDGLVIDEIVQLLVLPGTFTFGFFPLFKEGLDGQNPQLETESTVIPPRYLDFQ